MLSGDVNLLAVLVASIVSFLISIIWYTPKVFGNKWMKLAKVKPNKSNMAKSSVLGFITTLLTVYVLANIFVFAGVYNIASGMSVAVIVWLGFVATISLGGVLWEQKPVELWVLNAGHWLINFLVVGLILGAWI